MGDDLDPERDQSLYTELAPWWSVLSAPADYREEATRYADVMLRHGGDSRRTLLELGSGGGNNASHLKHRFAQLTLVDLSPEMIEVSRALNPECEHLVGDMRSVRLGKEFDCVFVHDAICYAISVEDLRRTIETAFVHCRSGGVALFVPDYVRETFNEGTEKGGHDGPERSLRYLAWIRDTGPTDTTYTVDYAILFKEGDGEVKARHERHVEGLFPRALWLEVMEDVGFDASALTFQHTEVEHESPQFIGVKP